MNTEKLFTSFPVLESANLTLKMIEDQHFPGLFSIYNNEKVFEYCGILPKHNEATVRKMISHFDRDYSKKSRVKWGIFRKSAPDEMMGIIEAMDFNQKVDMATIGYYLAEEHWGKGVATEAVGILAKYLIKEVEINRIQAEVMPPNDASKKVLLKNGFLKEGLLRQASIWTGKGVVDLEMYSLLKGDYASIKSSSLTSSIL